MDTDAISSASWDVIVIGSGMGGGTLAASIARRGARVLILEKGGHVAAGTSGIDVISPAARYERGWWPHPVSRRLADGRVVRTPAHMGCAVGGTSIHFGGTLERLDPTDFGSLDAARGRLPEWPVSFGELLPYYVEAERLYEVDCSTVEAFSERVSRWEQELFAAMRRGGLTPRLQNTTLAYDDDCSECVGVVCHRRCKKDARNRGVETAVSHPGCVLLTGCDVRKLHADSHRVTSVEAIHEGRVLALRGRQVVLAAGAMHTPQILLRSRDAEWPQGLANGSGQVGRNLMFHSLEILAIWAPRDFPRDARRRKTYAVRDFYNVGGERLGYIQSLGQDARMERVVPYVKTILRRYGIRNEWLLRVLLAAPWRLASRLVGTASLYAATAEDDPDPGNRIELAPGEPDGAIFTYQMTDELRERTRRLRESFARRIEPWRVMSLGLDLNYGHACGTARFGRDAATSVLDPGCRAHEVDNLYVVDASFMPRSGAVNPSLTIAANALRVADVLCSAPSAGPL